MRLNRTQIFLLLALLVSGLFYVSFSLSPSHYSVVLEQYLGLDAKPILGEARVVRGDEYSVVTPYFQIAVNNNFERYNQLSPYKEDLRFFYGLPLADWAVVFKPYMWGFWVLDAARAYSLYHFFMIAMFLVGHTIFFTKLRLPLLFSALLAALLFFSQHNQAWWSTNAPVFALTVWIVLPFLFSRSYIAKFLLTFYFALIALLALIYPPWQITLIYMYGIFALAFCREKFRVTNILVCLAGFCLAGGVYYLYQQDSIALMLNTVYPGERSLPGGYLPRYYLWAFFAPHALIGQDFFAISNIRNQCEIAVVSSILVASVVCFSNFKSAFKHIRMHLWSYSLIFVLLFVLFAWMYLPVPASIGRFILFDQINVLRILLTFGSSLIILAALLAYKQAWRFSWLRVLVFCFLMLVPPLLAYGHITDGLARANFLDWSVLDFYDYLSLIPLVSMTLLFVYHFLYDWRRPKGSSLTTEKKSLQVAYTLLFTALLYNIVAFSHFNPLQSSQEIFSKDLQQSISQLKSELKLDEDETILYQSHLPYLQTGAILNGLSLASMNHALLTPQLDFFGDLMPDTSPEVVNQAVNRYAKIEFSNAYREPKAIHFDVAGLPKEVAGQDMAVELSSTSIANLDAKDISKDISPENTVFPHELRWGKIEGNRRQLLVTFTSPFMLDNVRSVVRLPIDSLDNAPVEVSAKGVMDVNLPWYFADFGDRRIEIADIARWNLYLDFESDDAGFLKRLPAVLDKFSILDSGLDKILTVNLQRDIKVEDFSEKVSESLSIHQAFPQGYIDVATFNPSSGLLSLEGWIPVEDTQSVRWIGYRSDLDVQVVESMTVFRPGISSDFGKDLYKGFKLSLRVPKQTASQLELCLYGSTEALGIFPIHSSNIPVIECSVAAQLQQITLPVNTTAAMPMNGMVDHVRLGSEVNNVTLIGWAPKNTLDDISQERWFGYAGDVAVKDYSVVVLPRPDVANVFGDDFAMSGFQITLELDNTELDDAISDDALVDMCLFSRSEDTGDFFIPLSTNQNIFRCSLQQ